MKAHLVPPEEPQGGWRIAKSRPSHAAAFAGRARNIPLADNYWLWYQHRWIEDRNLMRAMEKSRRVGISYSTSHDYVRQHALAAHRADTWFSSRDEISALEFLRYCQAFARVLQIAAKDLGELVYDSDKKLSARVIEFANQTRINSLSGNPDAMASKGGNVGLDEFALRDDPALTYAIAAPTIDWGGRLSIISTHRGARNFFNEKILAPIYEKNNPMGWSHHRVTLQDALDQGFLWKLQSKLPGGDERLDMDEADYWNYQKNRAGDHATFLQEYMCVPEDEDGQFLPLSVLAPCCYPDDFRWRDLPGSGSGPRYLGVDMGREKDLTVMWVFERAGDLFFTREIVELAKTPYHIQQAEFDALMHRHGIARACIDSTGIGDGLAENSVRKWGAGRVEKIKFTGPLKETMAYAMRGQFEERNIRLPGGPEILNDLRSVRRETTSAGNIRLAADHTASGHADRFWACALALHAGLTVRETGILGRLKRFTGLSRTEARRDRSTW